MGRKLLKTVQTITTFQNPLADPVETRRGPPLVRGPEFENRWSSRKERAQLSQLSGGGFSNSELRMPNTADSHEYRPSDVTADFRHCQVGSRQFRSQYFSASKSSIKRTQIFFRYIFQNHRGITVSLDALCFEK